MGGIADEALSYCEELCESNKEGESCSQDDHCTPGTLFCDYKAADAEFKNGTCKPFPTNLEECVKEGFVASVEGKQKCVDCRLRSVRGCSPIGISKRAESYGSINNQLEAI